MEQPGKQYYPNDKLKSYHDRKFKVFKKMGQDQMEYSRIMKQ